jgi:hypothetical protein
MKTALDDYKKSIDKKYEAAMAAAALCGGDTAMVIERLEDLRCVLSEAYGFAAALAKVVDKHFSNDVDSDSSSFSDLFRTDQES